MIKAGKTASIKFGESLIQGNVQSPDHGVIIAGEKIVLNGYSIERGQVSPRTQRFFAERGGSLTDTNEGVRLAGGVVKREDLEAFVLERENEDIIHALKAVFREISVEEEWTKSNDNIFRIMITDIDDLGRVHSALGEANITFTTDESEDKCILITHDVALEFLNRTKLSHDSYATESADATFTNSLADSEQIPQERTATSSNIDDMLRQADDLLYHARNGFS